MRRFLSRCIAFCGALLLLTTCGSPSVPQKQLPGAAPVPALESPTERRGRVLRQLRSDILLSYSNDWLAFADRLVNKTLIDPRVGSARIGVGPNDVVVRPIIPPESWHRWPLLLEPATRAEVYSKRLRVWLSAQLDTRVDAAWMSDEVSWRIEVCGRTATIPLRITALFAHDGYRWYEVFEHVSFGATSPPRPGLRGARMRDATSYHGLVEYPNGELGAPLAALLSGDRTRIAEIVSLDPKRATLTNPTLPAPTFVLGPRSDSEWHGDDAITRLDLGIDSVQPEDRRAGLIGNRRTIAYWIGNFVGRRRTSEGSTGPIRFRGTFIFEKRCTTNVPGCQPDRWFVVQAHVSEAIEDAALAQRVFGSVVMSASPLRFACRNRPQ